MFVKLTPNEENIKKWWDNLEECKKDFPEFCSNWDKIRPITDKELHSDDGTALPGFYIGSERELYLFNEIPDTPDYFDSYMFFIYDSKFKSQYGVADNPGQIMDYFKREFKDEDRKFVVLLTVFDLEYAASDKFYKQGPYIGKCTSSDEYNPHVMTEEVKKNNYLIGFHIYPLPNTEPYPSRKYQILKKYVISEEPFSRGDTKIEIIKHSSGEYWRRNGDVTVRITCAGETTEEIMTVFNLVCRIYNETYSK